LGASLEQFKQRRLAPSLSPFAGRCTTPRI